MARHKEFDKDEVLQKAILVFWHQGYDATSVRDLIQAMGISTSSLYETFGDKRAVYIQALQAYCQHEQIQFKDMLAQAETPQIALKTALLDSHQHMSHGMKGLFSINSTVELGTRDPEITALLWDHYLVIWGFFREALVRYQTSGTLASTYNPGDLAHSLLTILYGYASIMRVKPDYPGTESILRSLEDLIR